MNNTAKNLVRTAGVVVGLGAAIWALRDRLLPSPEVPDEPPPRFRETAPNPVAVDDDLELTTLHGIGPATADRLRAAGVENVPTLAAADPAEISEATGASMNVATKWIETARAAE